MLQTHHELQANTTKLISDTLGPSEFTRLEQAHPQTIAHAVAVGTVLGAVALNNGASQGEANVLKLAGGLHDIGKPLSEQVIDLIDLPRRLTEEERQVVQTHTTEGSKYLNARDLGVFALVAEYHHTAHPRIEAALGTATLAGALILAVKVADVADAMTDFAGRPYLKQTLPREGLAEVHNDQLVVNPQKLAGYILATCDEPTIPVLGFSSAEIIQTTFALKGILPGTLDE